MRRANALVARFRKVLYEGHSVLLYNLLMKVHILLFSFKQITIVTT
jgi:hypothetical protein